jgi:rhodanese-related sulfurtransferase
MTVLRSMWVYMQAVLRYLRLKKTSKVTIISAEELKALIAKKDPNIILVNALAEKYHEDCHIPGSLNAPFHKMETIADAWDRSKTYVVYCADAACTASSEACSIMQKMGFKHILEYKNGIREWKEKGYPTTGACAMPFFLYKIT